MAAQASGAAPWLAGRPTLDAAQSVAGSAVASRVEAMLGAASTAAVSTVVAVSTAADTGRLPSLTPRSTADSVHCRPFRF